MLPRFSHLVDVPMLQQLMEHLWAASGLPAGIFDAEGNVLVATGWQPICTDFHRRNDKSLKRCRESEARIHCHLAEKEGEGLEYPFEYLCRNGLVEAALPILVGERHLATLFLGQFFYEPPEEEVFRCQAREFGFDEEPYLEALRQVPILPREKVRSFLAFYRSLVQLLGRLGSEKFQRLRAQEKLLTGKRRLQLQNREMRRIGGIRNFCSAAPDRIIPHILESTARTLGVARIGFWRFAENGKVLQCDDLFDPASGEHGGCEEFETSCFPDYFLSLESAATIAADRALTDPRTRELAESYLKPLGITSLLDLPVWLGGSMVGVLCCEHVGEPRRWSFDEQNFAASMADQISQFLEGEDRRVAEVKLRQSEEKYRLLFSNDSDGVLFFDAETLQIEEVNKAAAVLYGYSQRDFASLNICDISAEPEKTRQQIREACGKKMTLIPEALHRKRDGTAFPVEISHGTFDWKGQQMCVGVVRDVSERQAMMRLKDEMLSAVSHEIRTPLTAILGFAEFLRFNQGEEVPVNDYLDIILREGERLRELTDNLLDLQRLRAGFGPKNFRLMEVPPLIASITQLYDKLPGRRRLVTCRPEELPSLWGDERQLYRALQNLLANAYKYSPEGSTVELGVSREGDFLLFWVRDEGEGIPPEYQEEIFERFFRLDYQNGKQVGGTGLGLALVKAIAEAHRGQARVESVPGRGSKFILSIPYAQPEE